METTKIAPAERWRVIVRGNIEQARAAVAENLGSAPMSDVWANHFAVWATVWTDRESLERWFSRPVEWADSDYAPIGTLTLYLQP